MHKCVERMKENKLDAEDRAQKAARGIPPVMTIN